MTTSYPTVEQVRLALVERAERFCSEAGISIAELSIRMERGRSFMREIKSGERNFTIGTYGEVMAWLDQHWPTKADTIGSAS